MEAILRQAMLLSKLTKVLQYDFYFISFQKPNILNRIEDVLYCWVILNFSRSMLLSVPENQISVMRQLMLRNRTVVKVENARLTL